MIEKKWPQERVTHCDVVFEEKEFSVIFQQTTVNLAKDDGTPACLSAYPVFTAHMTPLHARELIKALEVEVASYESRYGKILSTSEAQKISKENAHLHHTNKRMKNRETTLLYTIPAGCALGMIVLGILLKWILF